jgi:hypothetical protein
LGSRKISPPTEEEQDLALEIKNLQKLTLIETNDTDQSSILTLIYYRFSI